MIKAQLRASYTTKRQGLSAVFIESTSRQICQQWQNYLVEEMIGKGSNLFIHVYLPIHSQNEVNTWPIINRLWRKHPLITVATSVSDFETGTLTHFELTPQTKLVVNRYGIFQPDLATSRPVPASAIDIVLAPLLIFDRQGHRVGYGKGFYDRFLAQCRLDCLKVGLSLFEPVERIDDVAETDVAMNLCLTESNVYVF